MSGLPPPVRRTLVTCSNPTCERFGHPGDKAPLKCASCKSARYCDRNCQRRHWRQHKEFCQVWAASSANNGQTLAQIKLKMAHLIWLLRGIPDYVKHMFEEYGYWRKQGRRGFIEFKFYYWEHLDNAINLLRIISLCTKTCLSLACRVPRRMLPQVPNSSPCQCAEFPLRLAAVSMRESKETQSAASP
ncbi:hypothetical protein BC826DRAFT_668893 [Russula brevipes]|nr:hypothetical protein BC826DRAFT_668893 [Russula brevipes]